LDISSSCFHNCAGLQESGGSQCETFQVSVKGARIYKTGGAIPKANSDLYLFLVAGTVGCATVTTAGLFGGAVGGGVVGGGLVTHRITEGTGVLLGRQLQ